MRLSLLLTVVCGAAGIVFVPRPAESCSCAGRVSSPDAIRPAGAVVFVGTVTEVKEPPALEFPPNTTIDGQSTRMIALLAALPPRTITLFVNKMFFGPAIQQIVLTDPEISCVSQFEVNETYLVYAHAQGGMVVTIRCSGTRLLAEATEDLKYLEGLREGRPQAVVYGSVFKRTGIDGRGDLDCPRPEEAIEVVALSQGTRFSTRTDRESIYQLVLPPGDAQIWLEHDGVIVSPIDAITLENGGSEKRPLVAAFR